jgi:hypothetical protein
MCLPTAQVDHFYSIWRRLLYYVNEQRQLAPNLLGASLDARLDLRDVLKIRDALWKDDFLLDEFVERNPAGLPAGDLALVRSWKHRRAGTFFVSKRLSSTPFSLNRASKARCMPSKGCTAVSMRFFHTCPS